MTLTHRRFVRVALFVVSIGVARPMAAQVVITGNITGQALDQDGGVLPGVDVSISSPAMIGGPRSVVTDDQGTYRFTLLVPGTYEVSFTLQGFSTLNIRDVVVGSNTTMTINGSMKLGVLSEAITVTRESPTIDLEAATVGVNWDRRNLETLPFGKSLPSLVSVIPGLAPTQYDVGASTMGGTAAPPAKTFGRSGGNVTTYDGVIWDQTFGDFGSYDEIQVTSAAKGAEAMNPGASFNFVIKSGGNQFRGSFLSAWQDDSFQSSNITQALLDRGLSPTSNQYTRYTDVKGDIGGPIVRNKLWFYGSYTDSYSGQYISGFLSEETGDPAVFYTRLYGPTIKLTYQPADKFKMDGVAQFNRKWQPYRGADQFKPLEATESQDFWAMIGSIKGTYIASPKLVMDAAINRSGYWWDTGAWTTAVRRTDQTTTQTRGANILQERSPFRWQWNGTVSWFPHFGGVDHELKSGFLGYSDQNKTVNNGYPNQQVYRYRSLAGEPDYFLHPDSVQVYDYPNFTASGVHYESAFVNDRLNLTRNLTVNVGLRYDRYSSWLPAQGNPGTGPFAEENIYPYRNDFPVYGNFVPRISAAYDLFSNGKIALKGSYGRYVGAGSGIGAAPGPTGSNVNPAAVIVKTYNNWDGSLPYVPIPANLASTSGGGGTQRLDTNLVAPSMDEFTAGVDLGLHRDYRIRFNAVYKRDHGGSKTLDLAQPYEAFTDVRSAVDPGRDNIAGTADDGVIHAWSVPRSYPTFGQVNRLITNVADGEGGAEYTAYEATFSKQYSNRWSFLLNGAVDRAEIKTLIPTNPNAELYDRQFPRWNYLVRMSGTYELPWGIMFASTYLAQSGEYFGRSVQMRNALNSTVTVLAEPNAGRYDWVKLWDNRISKTFRYRNQTIEASVDSYNTMNASTVLSQVNTNGPDYLKPSVGSSSAATASATLPPRIFRLGLRWTF
jgi:hypothetical protein